MPEDPDYPMNLSTRWTKKQWQEPSALRAHTSLSGKVMNPETLDVTVEAVGRHVTHLVREKVRVLAWLELLDRRTAATEIALTTGLDLLTTATARLEATVAAQTELLQAMVAGLGLVTVPPWQSLAEIEDGDSMGGLDRPSAVALGLEIVVEHERQVPGRQHEEIVAITPAPGSLVPRGSTITVTVNLNG